jgi:ubiquinone/menaquinone biosynthesis C-methylase UbiE
VNSLAHIYNTIADKYTKSFRESPDEKNIILDFIKRLRENAKVLDVGCGNSDYFELFNRSGVRYTGIDFSSEMIRIAQKNHPCGAFFVQDMNSMIFEQDSLDGIFCFFSLIHLPEESAVAFIKKAYQSLKSGGHILLGLQEGESELLVESPFLPGKKMFMNLYSEGKIHDMLQKVGFTIETFSRKPPTRKNQLPFNKIYILASK